MFWGLPFFASNTPMSPEHLISRAYMRRKCTYQDVLLVGGNVRKEGLLDLLASGERLAVLADRKDRNVELQRLGVRIANIHTTFVGEEDGVRVTPGRDADVELVLGGMGEEGFDDEVGEKAGCRLHLRGRRVNVPMFGSRENTRRTLHGFPARSLIHWIDSSMPLFRERRPAFPRRLMSMSGFATSLEVWAHAGSALLSGTILPACSSQEICAACATGKAFGVYASLRGG